MAANTQENTYPNANTQTSAAALYAEAQGQDTLLRGAADQAALHGVLAQIEAPGLELLEVRRVPLASREPARAVSPVTAKQLNGR